MTSKARVSRYRPVLASSVKLGLFGAACLVLMGWLVVEVGHVDPLAGGPTYRAQLSDATGLSPGAEVKVAGIAVGTVGSISLQRGHALVSFRLDHPFLLRRSTDVGMRWHDVLGTEDLYLYPGHGGAKLDPGSTIPLSHDVSDASVGKFLNDLGPFLTAINPKESNAFIEAVSGAIEGDDSQITQLVDSSATVSQTLGTLDAQIGSLIGNLSKVLVAFSGKNGDIQTVIGNLSKIAASLADRNGVLQGVVSNLSVAGQEFGGLLGSNQTQLKDAIANLDAVFGELSSESSDLGRGLSTLGAGLSRYIDVSAYGQWFQIQTVYSCMAGETECMYYMPNQAPAGSPAVVTAPGEPQLPPAPSTSGGSPLDGSSTLGTPSLGGLFEAIAGGGSS